VASTIRDIMTAPVKAVTGAASVADTARVMREEGIGDVIVVDPESSSVLGILSDRDIVVRSVADGSDPASTPVRDICSADLVAVGPDDGLDVAVRLMRERAVRRLPVSDEGRLVGMISLGDLAVEMEPGSVLADISAERPTT
jgi:CBS domain-containing protein